MKGISPVIATVLLLLMAVAAVGGAWVWYQRMQGSAQLGGGAAISNIQETANLQGVYINRAYADSTDTDMLDLYVGNQGFYNNESYIEDQKTERLTLIA